MMASTPLRYTHAQMHAHARTQKLASRRVPALSHAVFPMANGMATQTTVGMALEIKRAQMVLVRICAFARARQSVVTVTIEFYAQV